MSRAAGPGRAAAVLAAVMCCLGAGVVAGLGAEGSGAAHWWPEVRREHRPWTRWWWPGSAVTREGIAWHLRKLREAGFGGVEVTPIYGVKGAEDRFVPYLSAEWIDLLLYAAREAERLGMGLDMPPGSGWRTGGPFVTRKHAGARLKLTAVPVAPGTVHREDFLGRDVQAVVASPDEGLPVDLTEKIRPDGSFRWEAPGAGWTLYIAELERTGEKVKRAGPGGEGLAIDVYSREAAEWFFREYERRLAGLPRGTVRAWFHDSFEYTGNWTPRFFEEFRRRRGYDLKLHLPALAGRTGFGDPARVRADARETLAELHLENFVEPFTAWAHRRGGLSRNQAHGAPGNWLDLYAAADIPETEAFGRLEPDSPYPLIGKFASSAGHLAGRRLISSESFTWLDEHFQVTLAQMKRLADQFFLAGVNHMIYHGTAYSPPGARWPGWLFYASTQVNPRNPIWRDLPALNAYITRCQSLLQAGGPSAEALLYWPFHDLLEEPGEIGEHITINRIEWFTGQPVGAVAARLWRGGWAFDYVSDKLLERVEFREGALRAGASRYRTIVVPRTRRMPVKTLRRLISLAEAGATVIFHDSLPEDVPGWGRLEERRADFAALQSALAFRPVAPGIEEAAVGAGRLLRGGDPAQLLDYAAVPHERLTEHGIFFVRRRLEDGHLYFLANLSGEERDVWTPLGAPFESALLMDPMTGQVGRAAVRQSEGGVREVRLQLRAGESLLLRLFPAGQPAAPEWRYLEAAGAPVEISGTWQVRFLAGGPELPQPYATPKLESWTRRGGEAERFAGTAVYSIVFDAPGRAESYLLDLGRVAESARVRLNGRELGVLIAPPFEVETGRLRPTRNHLEVEVTSAAANRIRDLDRRGVNWKIFYDINFVNIEYKPFDASNWPVRECGLLGPVRLVPLK